jgi:hypothetical protein
MQRWQGAALAVVLCTGCLDPLVEDEPGYSRYIQPQGTMIPSAYADLQINRKIDMNDGATMPAVALKNGWAAGEAVRYWDFGAGKRSAAPAYGLARCGGERPEPIDHPVIVDNIPGDTDYSPYRAFQWACVTEKYQNEVVSSLDAFNDAIDLGLILDPTSAPATTWMNQPIVNPNVGGGLPSGPKPSRAYYRGTELLYYDMQSQESFFTYSAMPVATANVYELYKPGTMAPAPPARVIFAQPFRDPANPSARNPLYSPAWLVITVNLKAQADAAALDALIETLKSESDLVTVGMNNALTVKNPAAITSAVATTNRVNRPFLVTEVAP